VDRFTPARPDDGRAMLVLSVRFMQRRKAAGCRLDIVLEHTIGHVTQTRGSLYGRAGDRRLDRGHSPDCSAYSAHRSGRDRTADGT